MSVYNRGEKPGVHAMTSKGMHKNPVMAPPRDQPYWLLEKKWLSHTTSWVSMVLVSWTNVSCGAGDSNTYIMKMNNTYLGQVASFLEVFLKFYC